jgi:hypothetical protein
MAIQFKYALIACASALLIGLALGRYAAPDKVVTKEKVVHDSQDHSTITRTKEKKADGTTVVVTTIHKDVESSTVSQNDKTITRDRPKWLVNGVMGAEMGANGALNCPIYGIAVQRRIAGPFFIGAEGIKLSDGFLAGASVGVEF